MVPRWYRPVVALALLWNLFGCLAFLSDLHITPDDLAQMSDSQRALYEARPAWALIATAIAVWGGALGCIGLLLRQRWSAALLILSLLGVIVQDVALFGLKGPTVQIGPIVVVLQTLVLSIAVGLVVLARRARHSEWFV